MGQISEPTNTMGRATKKMARGSTFTLSLLSRGEGATLFCVIRVSVRYVVASPRGLRLRPVLCKRGGSRKPPVLSFEALWCFFLCAVSFLVSATADPK